MPLRLAMCLILLPACLMGCQAIKAAVLDHPRATEGGFDSPHPQARLYAITQAARHEASDEQTLRSLVESLDADDPLIRLMAITALRKITGESMDYRHYDPPAERRKAIARWKEYLPGDTLESSSGPVTPDKSVGKVNDHARR